MEQLVKMNNFLIILTYFNKVGPKLEKEAFSIADWM